MGEEELFDVLHRPGETKKSRIKALEKLSKIIDLNKLDYDYNAAIKAGMAPDERGHWENKFKKPSHITFGSDSIYSNPISKGGEWEEITPLPTGESYQFTPSLYQQLRVPKKEYENYFKDFESGKGGAILNYPKEDNKAILKDYIISNILKKK